MTCIATDGKVVAADGRSTTAEDLIISDRHHKLFYATDGGVVGCAGDSAACALARRWFKDGEQEDKLPRLQEQQLQVLVLRPTGQVQLYDALFVPVDAEVPAAIGSGSRLAVGAMLAGARPRRAVELAATRCSTVGGYVHTLRPRRKRK